MDTQDTQNTQRSAGVSAAAPDLLRERDELRAKLSASEAIRAELGWALEVAHDSLERISAAGPQIEEWHLSALAEKWNLVALASHTIHSETHRRSIALARSGGLEGVRRSMSSFPQ